MSSTWVPPGFLTGTTILTQAGYRAIEALRPSDKVITADGKVVHIDRIEMVQSKVPPYKIPRGVLKAKNDIYVSPRQRITYNDGTLHEVRKLGLPACEDTSGNITYYNVILDIAEIRNILAAGVEVEAATNIGKAEITKEEFNTLIRERYGSRPSDEIIQSIFKACKLLPNNMMEVPIFML